MWPRKRIAGRSLLDRVKSTVGLNKPQFSVAGAAFQPSSLPTKKERGGRSVSIKVDDLTIPTIKKILGAHVVLDSTLNTDEAQFYKKPGKAFAAHEAVNHGDGKYARGETTTNIVEGFFGIFKRGMRGVYHHCGEQH